MDEKLKEVLRFIKEEMEKSVKPINIYRYHYLEQKAEKDIDSLPSVENKKEFRYLLDECTRKGYLKQIELGTTASYALTEYGLSFIAN